jgi:hypothetical protein
MFSFQNGDGEVEEGGGGGRGSVVAVDHDDFEINQDGESTHAHSRSYSEDRKKSAGNWYMWSTVLAESSLSKRSAASDLKHIFFSSPRRPCRLDNKGCMYEKLKTSKASWRMYKFLRDKRMQKIFTFCSKIRIGITVRVRCQ